MRDGHPEVTAHRLRRSTDAGADRDGEAVAMTSPDAPARFDPSMVAGRDEPVRRYFGHAIGAGAALTPAVRLTMRGRIKVGAWLPFTAVEELDGRSFSWSARVALGPIAVLRAEDRFADGAGEMAVRLLGRLPLVRSTGRDIARSAAARAAVEAFWSPCALLPQRGVDWRAEADDHIVAACAVPPERPEVHFRIDPRGAVRAAWVARWRGGAYVPCGATVGGERRFGQLVVPSDVTVAWRSGTADAAPFFTAEVGALEPRSAQSPISA
jgi:hypothetical protein